MYDGYFEEWRLFCIVKGLFPALLLSVIRNLNLTGGSGTYQLCVDHWRRSQTSEFGWTMTSSGVPHALSQPPSLWNSLLHIRFEEFVCSSQTFSVSTRCSSGFLCLYSLSLGFVCLYSMSLRLFLSLLDVSRLSLSLLDFSQAFSGGSCSTGSMASTLKLMSSEALQFNYKIIIFINIIITQTT